MNTGWWRTWFAEQGGASAGRAHPRQGQLLLAPTPILNLNDAGQAEVTVPAKVYYVCSPAPRFNYAF